jgi:hypothetical protein
LDTLLAVEEGTVRQSWNSVTKYQPAPCLKPRTAKASTATQGKPEIAQKILTFPAKFAVDTFWKKLLFLKADSRLVHITANQFQKAAENFNLNRKCFLAFVTRAERPSRLVLIYPSGRRIPYNNSGNCKMYFTKIVQSEG